MQVISIGRDETCDIILNDNFVSRRHAQINVTGDGQIILRDLDSSNGTFVNGNRVNQAFLHQNDIVKCAEVKVNWQHLVRSHTNETHIQPTQVQAAPVYQQHNPQVQIPVVQQNQSVHQQNVIFVGKQKSVGTAFILAFIFGPLGLLYASVTGGLIMFLVGIVSWVLLPFIGYFLVWIGSIIWAVVAAGEANRSAVRSAGSMMRN